MQEFGTQANSVRKQVYCITHVYNLLSNEIGICLYIDPWRLQGGGGFPLEFSTTDNLKWKVKHVDC